MCVCLEAYEGWIRERERDGELGKEEVKSILNFEKCFWESLRKIRKENFLSVHFLSQKLKTDEGQIQYIQTYMFITIY